MPILILVKGRVLTKEEFASAIAVKFSEAKLSNYWIIRVCRKSDIYDNFTPPD
jgi:hypothetical protein